MSSVNSYSLCMFVVEKEKGSLHEERWGGYEQYIGRYLAKHVQNTQRGLAYSNIISK